MGTRPRKKEGPPVNWTSGPTKVVSLSSGRRMLPRAEHDICRTLKSRLLLPWIPTTSTSPPNSSGPGLCSTAGLALWQLSASVRVRILALPV